MGHHMEDTVYPNITVQALRPWHYFNVGPETSNVKTTKFLRLIKHARRLLRN